MNLTEIQQQDIENPALTLDERVLHRCRRASEFIFRGQYEAARETLGDLWGGAGNRPNMNGCTSATSAELLLQCGALSSGLGSAQNMGGTQEKAKDLISEAQRIFKLLDLPLKVAEAQCDLSVCYWRMGAFDEARVVLDEAAKIVNDKNDELAAKISIRRALIEIWACRYHDAWDILKKAEGTFKNLSDPLKGRWHTQMGLVLRRLGTAEDRVDYLDRAIIEHTAAIFHYEQCQNERYVANNLNNIAMLLYRIGRYSEAHDQLDKAFSIFLNLRDPGNAAQVNETRARVLLAENRLDEARTVIEKAVKAFEIGGEQSCLADALTIQATVMARLGDNETSLSVFQRAVDLAANAGAVENAGHASLSLIEEHGAHRLTELDVYSAYKRADEFLKGTQDAEDISRLRACAKIVMRRLLGTEVSDSDFVLKKALRDYEARFIEAALQRSGGKISQAASMLGLSHQTLSNILKFRQKNLQDKRLPPTPRRKSIVRADTKSRQPKAKAISVLYVEDDKVLRKAVKKSLEHEGFTVDVNTDGVSALNSLKRGKKYDVLLFDNEQQGINGIGLARQARELKHRRGTPIVVFSSDDVSTDAYRAGVNVFLHKPDDVAKLTENIKRLLSD